MSILCLSLIALAALISVSGQAIGKPGARIVDGIDAPQGRFPYYTSLRVRVVKGASFIPPSFKKSYRRSINAGDGENGFTTVEAHLSLTAAESNASRPAYAEDFERLGLNVSSFPNSFVPDASPVLAYVGAQGIQVENLEPNPVAMVFQHPLWDPDFIFADVTVLLLTNPEPSVPKVKLLNSSTDIYQLISLDRTLNAIGLGDYVKFTYSDVLSSLNYTDGDVNDDPAKKLQEADIGSLLPRSLCGKSNTISVQRPSNDGSGNVRYVDGYHAFVVNEGQICVTPAEDAEIEEYINEVSALLEQGILAEGLAQAVPEDDLDGLVESIRRNVAGYKGVCNGDSGGPVMLKGRDQTEDVQLGIASWTIGCGARTGSVWSNVQAYLQDSSGFDSFIKDVLDLFPDELAKTRMTASIPASVGASGK